MKWYTIISTPGATASVNKHLSATAATLPYGSTCDSTAKLVVLERRAVIDRTPNVTEAALLPLRSMPPHCDPTDARPAPSLLTIAEILPQKSGPNLARCQHTPRRKFPAPQLTAQRFPLLSLVEAVVTSIPLFLCQNIPPLLPSEPLLFVLVVCFSCRVVLDRGHVEERKINIGRGGFQVGQPGSLPGTVDFWCCCFQAGRTAMMNRGG